VNVVEYTRLTAENVRVLILFCETNGFVHEGGGEESGESGAECCSADEGEDEGEGESEDEGESEASSPHKLPSAASDSPSPVPSTSASDVDVPDDPLPSLLAAHRRQKAETAAMQERVAAWASSEMDVGIRVNPALHGAGLCSAGDGSSRDSAAAPVVSTARKSPRFSQS
jgi:hypothetical protein